MSQSIAKKYIAEFVYGATDGTITTFAIVSGVVGASLSPAVILLLGLSNVLADGFSMAASNFLAKRAESGMSEGESAVSPLKSAGATFASFVCVGMVPLLPFIVAFFVSYPVEHQFLYSVLATAVAFIFSGYFRGKVTGENVYIAAIETLLIGGVAAGIAYGVGYFLQAVV